jgi:hypothetical protein
VAVRAPKLCANGPYVAGRRLQGGEVFSREFNLAPIRLEQRQYLASMDSGNSRIRRGNRALCTGC